MGFFKNRRRRQDSETKTQDQVYITSIDSPPEKIEYEEVEGFKMLTKDMLDKSGFKYEIGSVYINSEPYDKTDMSFSRILAENIADTQSIYYEYLECPISIFTNRINSLFLFGDGYKDKFSLKNIEENRIFKVKAQIIKEKDTTYTRNVKSIRLIEELTFESKEIKSLVLQINNRIRTKDLLREYNKDPDFFNKKHFIKELEEQKFSEVFSLWVSEHIKNYSDQRVFIEKVKALSEENISRDLLIALLIKDIDKS